MYEQAKDYLLKIPFWAKEKNTLEQTRHILEQLGNPQEGLAVIHVAGTNGKGSVCADLTAVLKEAGYRVGTFVSPHLVDIRERFLINGDLWGRRLLGTVSRGFSPWFGRWPGRAIAILLFLNLYF